MMLWARRNLGSSTSPAVPSMAPAADLTGSGWFHATPACLWWLSHSPGLSHVLGSPPCLGCTLNSGIIWPPLRDSVTCFTVLSLSFSPGSPDCFTPGLSPATETTRSPTAPPGLSQCQAQRLSMPFNPAALLLPAPAAHARLLHITKIGCQLERQRCFPLDHSSVCRPQGNTSQKISPQWCWPLNRSCFSTPS